MTLETTSLTTLNQQGCLSQVFERQVANSKNETAIIYDKHILTYAELNAKANQLARILRSRGVKAGINVGLLIDRSVAMIVSVLAILKAGGTYVPMDPHHPTSRISEIFTSINASVILTKSRIILSTGDEIKPEEIFPSTVKEKFLLCDNLDAICSHESTENIPMDTDRHRFPVTILYTSGTTGKPKGIRIPHINLTHSICHMNYMNFAASDIVLQLASNSFDVHLFEIFGTLCHGGKLVLTRPNYMNLNYLGQLIKTSGVTKLMPTTSVFNELIDTIASDLDDVRHMIIGGEAASVEHCRKALRLLPNVLITNWYAPTEAAGGAIYHDFNTINNHTVPLGKPTENCVIGIFSVSEKGKRVGPNEIGEIYIGGMHVLTDGYQDLPEKTAEAFVQIGPEKFYKTGDLGVLDNNGLINFHGRKTRLIKLLGQRVELDAIDNMMTTLPGVEESHTMTKEVAGVHKELRVFYKATRELTSTEIFQYFESKGYTHGKLPHRFIKIDVMPKIPNGKVDEKALEKLLDINSKQKNMTVVAPQTPLQNILVRLWGQLLDIPTQDISIEDYFSELGGSSLQAMRMYFLLETKTDIKIPRLDYNIRALAGYLDSQKVNINIFDSSETISAKKVQVTYEKLDANNQNDIKAAARCATIAFVGKDEHGISQPISEPIITQLNFTYAEFYKFVMDYIIASVELGFSFVAKQVDTQEIVGVLLAGDAFSTAAKLPAPTASDTKVLKIYEILEKVSHNDIHHSITASGQALDLFIGAAIKPIEETAGKNALQILNILSEEAAAQKGYQLAVSEPTNSYSLEALLSIGYREASRMNYADDEVLSPLSEEHGAFVFVYKPLQPKLIDNFDPVTAVHTNIENYWREPARVGFATLHEISGTFIVDTHVTTLPIFNAVYRCGPNFSNTLQFSQEIFNVKSHCWLIAKELSSSQLGSNLIENNYKLGGQFTGMTLTLENLKYELNIASDVSLKKVENSQDFIAWAQPVQTAFGWDQATVDSYRQMFETLPANNSFTHYVALQGSKPLSSVSFFFERDKKTVGVYNCATIPQERKKGIMQSVLSRGLFKTQSEGYKYAVLYATAAGKNAYERLGFKPCSAYELYEIDQATKLQK